MDYTRRNRQALLNQRLPSTHAFTRFLLFLTVWRGLAGDKMRT
jgi:hypothetical protein